MQLTNIHRSHLHPVRMAEDLHRIKHPQRKKAANPFEKDFFLNFKQLAKPQFRAYKQFEAVRGCHPPTEDRFDARPSRVRRRHHPRAKQTTGVRVSLWLHQVEVRRAIPTPIHRYRVALLQHRYPDIYNDMREGAIRFDTSDYPTNHPNYSTINKKVLGKFKDETAGQPIHEFVGLRAKMYSIRLADSEKRTAKGVARYVKNRDLRYTLYCDCLLGELRTAHCMNVIRAAGNHHLYSVQTWVN